MAALGFPVGASARQELPTGFLTLCQNFPDEVRYRTALAPVEESPKGLRSRLGTVFDGKRLYLGSWADAQTEVLPRMKVHDYRIEAGLPTTCCSARRGGATS